MNPLVESKSDAGEKVEVRLQAVLALLSGEPADDVQARFNISRSSLCEYKRRALDAMREALKDQKRGPHHPHNRLTEEEEASVKMMCERHPTLSSYQVKELLGEMRQLRELFSECETGSNCRA